MATLCHICGCPLHPFGFQPLPCLHLRASHGYRSVVWSDCLASLHSSTGTLMVQVDHVMIHPAHRTCTSITCAPFRSSTYVPSIRILFRVSSRWIDGISLRWLRGCGENANRHVGSWEKLRPKDALTLDLVKVISLFQISTSLAAKCTVAQAAMLAERNGRPTTAQTGAAQHTMRLH